MSEVLRRLAEDGVEITRRDDGKVELSHHPKPRWSNPNFLSQEMESYLEGERRRAAKAEVPDLSE